MICLTISLEMYRENGRIPDVYGSSILENGRKPDVHGSLTLDLCPENGQKSFTSATKHMKTRGNIMISTRMNVC
ncbi:hypothetical protein NC652_034494 [Populus alba x Populus x berolinensis]|nr:hypothetical protein NC652_034494 [Populus alba x Populus x berolinensis]